jgi:hypothetical protein
MRTTLLLIALPLALLMAACGGSDHPCAKDGCLCEGETDCAFECDDTGCGIQCADVSDCDASCGDLCDYACVTASNCTLYCDDDCRALCEDVSNCDVDCGAGCDVTCNDLSNCRVTMISGVASCSNVSNCDIACAVPGGTVDATDCGDGLYACGACP